MFSVLFQNVFSTDPAWDYCIYDAVESECDEKPSTGASAIQKAFSALGANPISNANAVVYFTKAVTITDTQIAFFAPVLIKSSALNPTASNFIGAKVTITLTTNPQSMTGITLSDGDKFSLSGCTFTLSTLSEISTSVIDQSGPVSAFTIGATTCQLDFPTISAVPDFSTLFGFFTFGGDDSQLTLNFQDAPSAVVIDTAMSLTVSSFSLSVPLPTAGIVKVLNPIPTLDLTISTPITAQVLLVVTATPEITVKGSLTSTSKPVQIDTSSMLSSVEVKLPVDASKISTQEFVTATNGHLTFVSQTSICYYHKGEDPPSTGCEGYQLQDDSSLDTWTFTEFTNIKFMGAHVDVSVVEFKFDLSPKTADFTGGLIIDASQAYSQPLKEVVLPNGVSFGNLQALITLSTLQTTVSGISKSTPAMITAAVTVTDPETTAVNTALQALSADGTAILLYETATALTLKGISPTTINDKVIDYTKHSFTMSTANTLESFNLEWSDNNPVIPGITLNADYTTTFNLLEGHQSQQSVVSVDFVTGTQPNPKVIPFTAFAPYLSKTAPFTDITSGGPVTFYYSKPFCVYDDVSLSLCVKDDGTPIAVSSVLSPTTLQGATSITFRGSCKLDIANLPLGKDYTNDQKYIFGDGDMLLLVDGIIPHVDQGELILNSHVQIASAMKASKITAPPSSFGNKGLSSENLEVTSISLEVTDEAGYTFFPVLKAPCTITFEPSEARDTLTFADGTVDTTLVKVSDGTASFEAPAGLSFVFGSEPHSTFSIIKNTDLTINGGVFSASIEATGTISLSGSKYQKGNNYFTFNGLQSQAKMFVLCTPAPDSDTQNFLTGATFSYVGSPAFCIYSDNQKPTECANLESSLNGVGKDLSSAGYVLVIGSCQCDLGIFVTASNNVIFSSAVYHFQGDSDDITITTNNGNTVLTELALIDKIKVDFALTTSNLVCPLSCIPGITKDISTTSSTITLSSSGQVATPTSLAHIIKNDGQLSITLNVDNSGSSKSPLNLAYSPKTTTYTINNQLISNAAVSPTVQSSPDATEFSFDILGDVPAPATVLIATVKLPSTIPISLGSGFNTAQGTGIITAVFTPPSENIRVAVQPGFDISNKPFTNDVDYALVIAKLCVYVEAAPKGLVQLLETQTSCSDVSGYTATASNSDLIGFLMNHADQVMIAETMTIPAATLADGTLNINIDSRYSTKSPSVEFKVEFTKTQYTNVDASFNGVTFIVAADPSAQTLDPSKVQITNLQCYPSTVNSFNAEVNLFSIYVDPTDSGKYETVGTGKIETSSQAFLITGETTTASIVFKPSTTDPLVEVCKSSYGWPSSITSTTLGKPKDTGSLDSVEVDLVPDGDVNSLAPDSVTLLVKESATVTILEGFKSQADNPFKFPSGTSGGFPVTVVYPESFDNKFVTGPGITPTEKTWSPTKPTPTPDDNDFPGWAIAVIVIVVVIVVAVVVVVVLNFTGVIHLCGNKDDAPSV